MEAAHTPVSTYGQSRGERAGDDQWKLKVLNLINQFIWLQQQEPLCHFWPPAPSESFLSCVSWLTTFVACVSWLTTSPSRFPSLDNLFNVATPYFVFLLFPPSLHVQQWLVSFLIGRLTVQSVSQSVQFSQTQHLLSQPHPKHQLELKLLIYSQPHPKHQIELKLCWSIRNHILNII